MKRFSYKKSGLLLKVGLLAVILGLFASPSYSYDWDESCLERYKENISRAIRRDDIICAKELIQGGADVNGRSRAGGVSNTPLFHAVANQNKELVALMIEKGVDPFANIAFNWGGFWFPRPQTAKHSIYFLSKEASLWKQVEATKSMRNWKLELIRSKRLALFTMQELREDKGITRRHEKEEKLIAEIESLEGQWQIAESELEALQASLKKELANGWPDFDDPTAEEIYDMLDSYEYEYLMNKIAQAEEDISPYMKEKIRRDIQEKMTNLHKPDSFLKKWGRKMQEALN